MRLQDSNYRKALSREEPLHTPIPPSRQDPSSPREDATTASKAKSRARDLEIVNTSGSKSRKSKDLSRWTQQSTLTQIDFLQPSPQPPTGHESSLDYIDPASSPNSTKKDIEVIEIDSSSDKQQRDRSFTPRTKKPDLSTNRNSNGGKRVKFRSSTKTPYQGKTKMGKSKNKTLTQMDFVRRIIILDSDDEPNLDYIKEKQERASNNTRSESRPRNETNEESSMVEWPGRRKRRKLTHGSSPMPTSHMMPPPSLKAALPQIQAPPKPSQSPDQPKTPQKSEKSEIPSSQSPATPLALKSSPPFRDTFRSPLHRLCNDSSPTRESAPSTPLAKQDPSQTSSPNFPKSDPRSTMHSGLEHRLEQNEYRPIDISFEKTVIYETDAESDDFDTRDPPPSPGITIFDEDSSSGFPTLQGPTSEESPDLPHQVPNSGTDLEGGGDSIDGHLHSEASVYYHRPNPSTQFPLGPAPTLNTQRMAELFPNVSDHKDQSTDSQSHPQESVRKTSSDILCPQTQTQVHSLDPSKAPTDMVPESSPVAPGRNLNGPQSIVLVESSQPVDRINRRSNRALQESSGPTRLLSASYWLTDSAMESLPLPPGWTMSQDSVGEPYSEN